MRSIVFVDTEVNPQTNRLLDLGAVKPDQTKFHSASRSEFAAFIAGSRFLCGHNLIAHDIHYIAHLVNDPILIDTLCLSPLLFPQKPYHALLKDDKLQTDELNNPLNDAIKAMELFYDEVNAFNRLSDTMKAVYFSLLRGQPTFSGFFKYLDFQTDAQTGIDPEAVVKNAFAGMICENAPLIKIITQFPVALAYCLALIATADRFSLTPPWVHKNYPTVEPVMKMLRSTPCAQGCPYCEGMLDVCARLKSIFGYDTFRTYNGEPLQEMAAKAAVHNRSLLAIFPTGGGKSITFQLPALMAGETVKGLTVVISPLQSLMKDQVDNLSALGIADAVTINGLLSPLERAEAFARVESGLATLLYISPESLRSRTVERLLLSRHIARFVIDEAHCFSSWGQDFRVDYLYIGDFIKELQQLKGLKENIPISCFTATAKQKVVSDIRAYFKQKLNVELDLYATDAARTNLRYEVLHMDSDRDKYTVLRGLLAQRDCPVIVYVSRVKRTYQLVKKLTEDGFSTRPYNGRMPNQEKITNQEDFIAGRVQIIVATSAFGMGVDKKDVKLVVHYDISDSLENYVQEAGRAGRDENMQAECYVLFNDNDLDKHFILLNQTKLSISEIQQVWKAIKALTRTRSTVCRSPLELARQAGWDETGREIETKVKTAVLALETAGYINRGMNVPHIYAASIRARNMEEASAVIQKSRRFNEAQKENASRIIARMISNRSTAKAGVDEAETRVDYLSDLLGIPKAEVLAAINLMREEGLLADSKDLTAYIRRTGGQNKTLAVLQKYARLEGFLAAALKDGGECVNLKEINERAEKAHKDSSVKSIKTLLYYWTIKGYIQKTVNAAEQQMHLIPEINPADIKVKYNNRIPLAKFIVNDLYERSLAVSQDGKEEVLVEFSVLDLKNAYDREINLFHTKAETTCEEVEDALLYLSKIDALTLEGGFLVLYNAMEIVRLELDNRILYKNEDYRQLNEYYKQKIQQIHIVGEYANMMVRDYREALQFVSDYFQMDYKQFIAKYFKGTRLGEINRNITPAKYQQLFGRLSEKQLEIINDDRSKYIVVAAGPGSGKTRVLAHKLAALQQLEDVKHEQLLMLTFSRAAATEFKQRLYDLIENAAHYIEIKTFHSYCFDLLGQVGSLETADMVVQKAVEKIKNGEVETRLITKTVLVIDEAQDMRECEYALVEALMDKNEEMRVIAVGDDDQSIYEFCEASSKYLKAFLTDKQATLYEMTENYRSKRLIVALANAFSSAITQRLKRETIRSVCPDNGVVALIKHNSRNLEIPVVNAMKAPAKNETVCVLTNTNEEALKVSGLLVNQGFRAKFIQSNDGFDLLKLAEFRYFLKIIRQKIQTPVISDDVWCKAKDGLQSAYERSDCLPNAMALLRAFEQTNTAKYLSDLENFIQESNWEDYSRHRQHEIFVSTIHAAKGREFDRVYLMLNNPGYGTDERKRLIYVGLTRAKNELYVHYNQDYFDGFAIAGVEKRQDPAAYPEPDEITVQLSHKDVNLGFFKGKKHMIGRLQSGRALTVGGDGALYAETSAGLVKVLLFSKKFLERMDKLQNRGYSPYKAKIRFVVAWKGEEDEPECAVILPDVYFKKV